MAFKLEQTETGIAMVITPDTLCVEKGDNSYAAIFQ